MIFKLIPILIVAGIFATLMDKVVWNLTDSVSHRFGFISSEAPQKGDYVVFDFRHPLILDNKQVRLTKKYICEAGDFIETKNRDIYCNNVNLGSALEQTESGKQLEVFKWKGIIPEGKVFVIGDSASSFDSRYWGFVDYSSLRKVNTLKVK